MDVDYLGERILAWYGAWYVTPTAIVAVLPAGTYELTRTNLECGIDWDAHMSGKRWCAMADFRRARAHLFSLTQQEAA